ncbi:MAG: HIT family protein [Flavobacteriales bacterium CG_4_10_14_0_2_um_filter_32_8]|nr:MAG: HIT family protein [Flavobacteriales bacterium CG_4_10_14_0_2_um_filter_32_8]PJB15567.1 MAG: HIT family protein [Flavobacteriales bacterium CG_4_9_14_3_um_filter_32_8]
MESVFTKIIRKEIPAYIIEENEHFIAFLDVFPIAYGHTLIVPKKQIDYIFDIENSSFAELWIFAKKIAAKIEKAVICKRIGIAVIGLEVPHAHIHLVPLNKVEDINFSRPKLKFEESELVAIQKKIINS